MKRTMLAKNLGEGILASIQFYNQRAAPVMSQVASVQPLPLRTAKVERKALAQLQRAPGGTFTRGMLHHAKAHGFGASVVSLKTMNIASMVRNAAQSLQHYDLAIQLLEEHVGFDFLSTNQVWPTPVVGYSIPYLLRINASAPSTYFTFPWHYVSVLRMTFRLTSGR